MNRADFKYVQLVWGEVIRATKEQLQSFGIGAGLQFPGEPGGPKRSITVDDPRGYKARIAEDIDGLFRVQIRYPGRKYSPPIFTPKLSDSVRLGTTSGPWANEYLGSAAALIDAGLVQRHQLPGQPGGPKVRVTLLPDGTVTTRAGGPRDAPEGSKVIIKASKSTFRVIVSISACEKARRSSASNAHYAEWSNYCSEQPRPAPLHAVYREMKRLAMLPKEPHRSESPEAFRDDLGGMAGVYIRALLLRCEDAAYRMTDEAKAAFENAAKQLENAIRSAAVVPAIAPDPAPANDLHGGFWLRAAGGATG